MRRLFSSNPTPGQTKGSFRAISMPIALSNGVAAGSIVVPTTMPAIGTHLKFAATFGGCVCAAYTEFPCYCIDNPAPVTPSALAMDIADFFNSQPDVSQYLYFTAVGTTISYVSILPGLVISSIEVPGGFTHSATNNGLIACSEIKPGRAVVTNPCRVPASGNPWGVALAASTDPGDMFVGISRAKGGCSCSCKDECGCKCFTVVTNGTIGIELLSPPPTCPTTGPLKLAYSNLDGRFILYIGALPVAAVAVDRPFTIKGVFGLSALITFG